MRVAVFGATGGTGRAVTAQALAAGHSVTAFARNPDRIKPAQGQSVVEGDAAMPDQVRAAVAGHDAVVISLGNSQNAFALLLGMRRTTPRDICATGTRNILAALPGPATPVIVVGAFGTGDTRAQLPLMFKLFYRLFLREQMADKEQQDAVLKASSASYTLIQPVALTDKPGTGTWSATRDGTFRKSEVSRADLAAYIVTLLADGDLHRDTVTFSG